MKRLLVAGFALLFALLLGPALAIGRHIPLNYNEGWNAYRALAAITRGAGPLYPPPGGTVFNNYPPLSFYLVGALGRFVIGDMIVAGRIVALASLLACGAMLAVIIRKLGAGWPAAALAGLVLPVFAAVFFRDYVAMDDPQWLAHALMLSGLAVLLRRPRLPLTNVVLASLLVLAGGLTKHNLVALPGAVTIWLLIRDPRAGLAWCLTGTVGLAAAALWLGPLGLADILHYPRLYDLGGIMKGANRLLPLVPMIAITCAVLARARSSGAGFALLFLGLAVATGLAQRAGVGVAVNAGFETLIAACLGLGLALGQVERPALWAGMAALPILLVLPKRLHHAWDDVARAQAREAAWRPVIAAVAASAGPAACEDLAVCYWAGRSQVLDLFNLTQAVRVRGTVALPSLALIEIEAHSSVHAHDPVTAGLIAGHRVLLRGPGGVVVYGR